MMTEARPAAGSYDSLSPRWECQALYAVLGHIMTEKCLLKLAHIPENGLC